VQFGRATLTRGDSLRLKSEFAHVRNSGIKFVGTFMLLVTAPAADGRLRFGIICGKKYSRKAVARNRARRLLKESFRLLKSRLIPVHCVLIARMSLKNAVLQDVQQDMLKLLRRADILLNEE